LEAPVEGGRRGGEREGKRGVKMSEKE